MTDRIFAGASVLMTSLATLTGVTRLWPPPTGRHRATDTDTRLVEPMPGWPEPVYGAAVPQAFRHCRGCRGDAPVTLHPGAHTCQRGHVTITTTTRGNQ